MNYDKILNQEIKKIQYSGIRKFFDIAMKMDDIISLGIGEPDFPTPWNIRQEGINSLVRGHTWYSPNSGLIELRKEICKYIGRTTGIEYSPVDETLVTVGGSEAIDLAIRTITNPGDEVLIHEPSFVCYKPIISMSGAKPVIIDTYEENKFRIDAKDLEKKITDKTKAIILSYPNNPTGAIMSKDDLEKIAKIVKKHNLIVVSDEIYSELVYSNEPNKSIVSIDGMKEHTILINGFSKAYAMTGWRMGYALGPKEILSQMIKLHQYAIMCAPTTTQYAAIEALKNGDKAVQKMRTEYNMRKNLVVNELRKIGFSCVEPEGTFYIFPNISMTNMSSQAFCKKLVETKHVAIVPGDAFGKCGENFVRISYSYSLKHLEIALERIKEFIEEL